jgi:hypothetical protein
MNDHDDDNDYQQQQQQQPTNCASDMGFCWFQNLCDVIAPVSRHVHKGLNLELWILRDERDSESRLLLLRIMGPTSGNCCSFFGTLLYDSSLLQWLLMLQIHELRLSCKFLLTLQNFLIATIDILSPIFSSVKQHQHQQQQQQDSQISSPNKQNSFHQQWSQPNKYKISLHQKFSPPNKQKQISPPKIPFTQLASTNISPPTSKTKHRN